MKVGVIVVKRKIRLKEMEPGIDLEQVPTPEYRARVASSLGAGPFRVRTDADGFIITGNSVSEDDQPIVFVGDSFVESLYTDENTRFVAGVERRLRDSGRQVRCLNGGYSGATSLQLLNVLVSKIFPIVGVGGHVVFFVPQSDANIVGLPATYWNASKRNTVIVPGREPSAELLLDRFDATKAILRLVVSACEHLGIKLVLAISPYRVGNYETDELVRSMYSNEDRYKRSQDLRGGLVQAAIDVSISTNTPLLNVSMREYPHYFYDELHLTDVGQKSYADNAADHLLSIIW